MARKTIKRAKFGALKLFAMMALAVALFPPRTSLPAEKRAWDLENAKGKTVFRAIGRPSLLRVKGSAHSPKGRIVMDGNAMSGVFTVALGEFDTGISLRNTHMREKYLEVAKYPQASLEIKKLLLPEKGEVAFDGALMLHGVTKPVQGKAQIERRTENGAELLRVEATFELKISDFEIQTPSYAGITVADVVTVAVECEAPYTQYMPPKAAK